MAKKQTDILFTTEHILSQNIGFAIWWLMNMCLAIVLLLNFNNKLKLMEHEMPPHRIALSGFD